ncbi:MAG: hypothetical protein AB2693_11470 [Candidatus Thiodiazotropha sp.]
MAKAKRFEGVSLCKKSVLNSKIKVLKKSVGARSRYIQNNTHGVLQISTEHQNGGTLISSNIYSLLHAFDCSF